MEKVSKDIRTAGQNKKLYWLLGMLNIKDKEDIGSLVWSHTEGRTVHTSELTFIECRELIRFLDDTLKNSVGSRSGRVDKVGSEWQQDELNKKRKGVIKAIFAWLESKGGETPTMEYVKSIACRAANVRKFNDISSAALTRIYNEFCEKQQVTGVINRFKNR